jgi:hypothetical protein
MEFTKTAIITAFGIAGRVWWDCLASYLSRGDRTFVRPWVEENLTGASRSGLPGVVIPPNGFDLITKTASKATFAPLAIRQTIAIS